jgi:hypothetical protein
MQRHVRSWRKLTLTGVMGSVDLHTLLSLLASAMRRYFRPFDECPWHTGVSWPPLNRRTPGDERRHFALFGMNRQRML